MKCPFGQTNVGDRKWVGEKKEKRKKVGWWKPSAEREWLRELRQLLIRTLCFWGGEVRSSEVFHGNAV